MVDPLESQSRSLTAESGFVVLTDRFFARLTGEDRKSFLHNFCTNEIRGLEDGQICEAFVLNTKGKLLGFVHVLATKDEIYLTGHGDQAESLISHLDMYLIREDVVLANATDEFASVFVCGEQAAEKLKVLGMELPTQNRVTDFQLGDIAGRVLNLEVAGFGYLLVVPKQDLDELKVALVGAGIAEASPEALEIVRVEEQTPWFGIDADDSNLPQELQRDEKAISFDKGCYLGQETVARIDARGRVNNLLVGLKFTGDKPPSAGDALIHEEKTVGRVTSVVYSPQQQFHIGLGYVRRGFQVAGTELNDAIVLG